MAIVDAAEADMSGWSIEIRDEYGRIKFDAFERGTAYGQPNGNLIGYGVPSEAWLAYADQLVEPLALIAPDGTRHVLDDAPGSLSWRAPAAHPREQSLPRGSR